MAGGQELIEQIRKELEPVGTQLRDHRCLRALEQSDFARDSLSAIVGEQHTNIENDLRSLAAMVARCDHPRSRRFFLGTLRGHNAAFGALHDLVIASGLDKPSLQAYELRSLVPCLLRDICLTANLTTHTIRE